MRKGYLKVIKQIFLWRGLASVFEKILVPLDGSEHSVRALKVAVQTAKKFHGKVTLIHVYSKVWPIVMPHATVVPEATVIVPKLIEAAREAGAGILADGEKKVKAEGLQVETLLREGHTVEEILKAAGEGEFDLIVMGARGLSRIKEILLGSVSDGVMRHACCPVLVVK
jgi:nucleotide-binding universal stress UspA family protein